MRKTLILVTLVSVVALSAATLAVSAPAAMCVGVGIDC